MEDHRNVNFTRLMSGNRKQNFMHVGRPELNMVAAA